MALVTGGEGFDVVLLGATGLMGQAILRQRGAHSVHALVRSPDGRAWGEDVHVHRGDLHAIPEALFPSHPYVVLHFATKPRDTDGTGFERTNVEGTQKLLSRLTKDCRGVIHGSSMSVYGPGPHLGVTEAHPLNPVTPLARSRVASEALITKHAAAAGMGAALLRTRFLIGQGDRFVLPAMVKMLERRRQLGADTVACSVIDVDDHARIIWKLARRMMDTPRPEQRAYNVAYSRPLVRSEFLGTLVQGLGLPPPVVKVRVPDLLLKALRDAPSRRAQALAERLELLTRSQCLDVARLKAVPGMRALLARSPVEALRAALDTFRS
ncbi:NAD-dependent epimerase/dehydratase family protein [Corallococcus sp. CA047B]|uniref:NAD-dependent epimerase/dehydratase family protein n=1 Tax=Corallococcus sp. CA047B TaxID=2316729 RepID=UPI000EA3A441|nr:NAD-dependent epimerase/dehydratase family protein [Corallococcus sp. CA047B]RKH19744.1 NAD-dependent epimerase/dehydratase family protein [Corallococcus sp. CA047B]